VSLFKQLAGFNIHLFPTGQGNIVGNPIEPVVKLTANPLTAKLMSEHVDCDVSKILSKRNEFISSWR
jgi:(2R)-sulfolactate sulfo-lyase subunit beta